MFRKLRVKNFRSILDSGDLEFSNLNIIVGANNSGKSSILYALLMVKQTLQDRDPRSTLVTCGPNIDLGSYLDIVRGGDPKEKLGIEFEIKEEAFPRSLAKLNKVNIVPLTKFKVDLFFKPQSNTIAVQRFEMGNKEKTYQGVLENGKWELGGIREELKAHIRPVFDHFLPSFTGKGKPPDDKNIIEEGSNLFLATRIQISCIEEFFNDILYVGPIRERIPRYEILGTTTYCELGPSGQNLMRVLSDLGKRGMMKGTIIRELNHWLEKKFGILKNVRIEKVDRTGNVKAILADDMKGEKRINLASMGSGLSQIVPVIVQTVLTRKGRCVIVEQPEIHLHPAAQANLGDLFVECAKENRQLIIETHSEHLILRIRRRIAEKKIAPELVKIFLVEKEDGATRIKPLALKDNGHFLDWPKGFFEEGFREAMALADAQSK